MNMQSRLIWELMLHEFKLGHNAMEAIKNICCTKGEGAVDHSTVTRSFKEFHLGCKNLNEQASHLKHEISEPAEISISIIKWIGFNGLVMSLTCGREEQPS
ncbi:Hypothetical predicted protein [Octopus vulgaris]|uniref:Mos1 transposase HTH domain-containing protein n=1 Tax=Octopus vulgaris TaxID=6645 RepID=A0AA36BIB6_OCTVU|nr:Hypothetical predicted protein [Octopus vulgaris]